MKLTISQKAKLKTAIYVIRLFFIVLFVCFLWRHGATLRPCYYTHPNGTTENPGLYGNCQYLQDYINAQTLSKQQMDKLNLSEVSLEWNKTKE